MHLIPDKSIDMILCDLPYGTTACKWDTIIPFEPLWEQYNRIIKSNGVIVLFGSQPFTSKLITSNIEMFKYEIIWVKSHPSNSLLCNKQVLKYHENICVFYRDLTKNNDSYFKELRNYFKQIYNDIGLSKKQILKDIGQQADHCFRFNSGQWGLPTKETYEKLKQMYNLNLIDYEVIQNKYLNEFSITYNPQMVVGEKNHKRNTKGSMKSEIIGSEIDIVDLKYDGMKYPKSYYMDNTYLRGKTIHPTQKPVELCEWLIKMYSNEGETVLDNCMGSGTTAIACINTNRNYIGFELDENYYNLANKRIQDHLKNLNTAS